MLYIAECVELECWLLLGVAEVIICWRDSMHWAASFLLSLLYDCVSTNTIYVTRTGHFFIVLDQFVNHYWGACHREKQIVIDIEISYWACHDVCCEQSEGFHLTFLILKHRNFEYSAFRCTHDVVLVKCNTACSLFICVKETVLILLLRPCHADRVIADGSIWFQGFVWRYV